MRSSTPPVPAHSPSQSPRPVVCCCTIRDLALGLGTIRDLALGLGLGLGTIRDLALTLTLTLMLHHSESCGNRLCPFLSDRCRSSNGRWRLYQSCRSADPSTTRLDSSLVGRGDSSHDGQQCANPAANTVTHIGTALLISYVKQQPTRRTSGQPAVHRYSGTAVHQWQRP